MKKNSNYEPTIGLESTNPKDMPKDHSEIPVWNSENWFYEDVIIDHKIRSLRRTISEGEAMQFNCMVLDMHPYVADEHFAKDEGIFNKRLVAGAMVFSYGLAWLQLTALIHLVTVMINYDLLNQYLLAIQFTPSELIWKKRQNMKKWA